MRVARGDITREQLILGSLDHVERSLAAIVATMLEQIGFPSTGPATTVPSSPALAVAAPASTSAKTTKPVPQRPTSTDSEGNPYTASAPKPAPTPVPSAVEGVTLKDGTVLQGRILKQVPGTFVTIELADGTQRTLAWDRVSEVVVVRPGKAK